MPRKNNLQNKSEYYLDTSKQIKIWFSTNPEVFLPTENILRFAHTIILNKDTHFSFIYSAELLSKHAIAELNHFCQKFNVTAIDIKDFIAQENTTNNPVENDLNEVIISLIDGIKTSKNASFTAIASDLIRLKKEILKLGLYTDSDAVIDFSSLEQKHPVKAPLLSSMFITNEKIINNNDFVALALDKKTNKYHPESLNYLNTVQKIALKNIESFSLKNIGKHHGKICKIIPKIQCTSSEEFSQFDILDIMLSIFIKNVEKESISIFSFLNFIEKYTTEEVLGNQILKRVLSPEQLEDLMEALKDKYEVKTVKEVYNYMRIEFTKILVINSSGPQVFYHFFNKLSKGKNLNDFTLKSNNLDKIIATQGDQVTLDDGREVDRNGDNTWLDQSINKNSILLNNDAAQILQQETIKYLLSNVNKDDPRHDYIFEQIFKFEEIYRTFINNQNEKFDSNSCPNIYSVREVIDIKIKDKKLSLNAASNGEEQAVIKNIIDGIKSASEGKIGIVPIFLDYHWTGMIFKQDSAANVKVIFIDSLGKSFDSYNSESILEIIKQQTNNSFTIIEASDLGLETELSAKDCGFSAIADLNNIAISLAGEEIKVEL